MAIDTRDKRASVVGTGSPVPTILPDPDGTIGTSDRAMLTWLYAGLTIEEPFEPSKITLKTTIDDLLTFKTTV